MEVVAQQPWGQFTEEENGGGGEELLTRETKKRQLHHAHGSSNGNRNGNGAHHANGGEEEEHANGGEQEEGEEVKVDPEEEEQQQHKSISIDPAKEGKGLEAHENGNAHETNHGSSNGKLENGSHSNGSHQVPDGAEPKINKTEIYPTEDDKVEHVTGTQPKVEEYDLKKILDEQETHELECPYCRKFITRRVILTKRKRTGTPDEPSKRHVPFPLPGGDEPKSPDVFRCLSCFSFFVPTGCTFNIFRIFGRRDADGQLVLPPASEDTPPQSENCTSWLLSCFQPGDSPNQPAPSDPATVPLLPSQDTVVKPEQLPVESPSGNQRASHPVTMSQQFGTVSTIDTTRKTEESKSYFRDPHGKVVKQDNSMDKSPSGRDTITIVTTNTETTKSSSRTISQDANTSSQMSGTETYHQHVTTDKMSPLKPTSGAIVEGTQHLPGNKDFHGSVKTNLWNDSLGTHDNVTVDIWNWKNIAMDNIPTLPNPQAADPPHVVVPFPEDVNQPALRPQQRDDWDILKAIVYGGLVESVTSLSVVSAAASSGAKTLDIFILGIANLIGGLPLIFHNIADLRDIRDVDGEDEQVGHYWLQLGRRSKARLHMVMALLSYMVFGLLPPVLYGLSFRESNNRENKMMAVAGASLACIALLALGKAHVNRRPRTYFKTLMYYLTMAVSSSGLSYVAGVLITRLLVQYGIIEQGGSAAPAPPGLSSPFAYAAVAETSAWASF